MLRSIVVVSLVMLGLACGSCPKPKVKPPLEIVRTVRSCAENLPPAQPKPEIDWGGPEDGCPQEWETCLDGENADRLATWIEKALAYQRAVQAECSQGSQP